jgi:hypothetical protein
MELTAKSNSEGFIQIRKARKKEAAIPTDRSIAYFPARILGYSIAALSALILALAFLGGEHAWLIGLFAGVLLLIGMVILALVRKPEVAPLAVVTEKETITLND